MIARFLRCVLGILLLPACWALFRSLVDALRLSAGAEGPFSVESLSLLFGMCVFLLCWLTISRPVRAYVLGHELTHALWGLLFGAVPSSLRVSATGGSVRLTKTNFIITLAPYFFPFYTFIVIVAALVTAAFWRPLPCLPLWLFLIGFTWAFHVLFTLETLRLRQPDVKAYGRVFSWTVIFAVNVMSVLVWLAATTPLTFGQLGEVLLLRLSSTHSALAAFLLSVGGKAVSFARKS